GADGEPPLDPGPGAQLFEPALDVTELFEVLILRLPANDPRIRDHVGDRVFGAREVAAVVQAVVQDAVEPIHFVAEPAERVGLVALLGSETEKMSELPALGALVGDLPDDPLGDLGPRAQVRRPELAGLLREVEQDRAGFEDRNRRSAARGR